MALRACIVGAGPSGLGVARVLLAKLSNATVDVVERLAEPFGLVRWGRQPLLPDFTRYYMSQMSVPMLQSGGRCSFYGGVQLGKDVTLEQLRENYDMVVLAHGLDGDERLGIQGEHLHGVGSVKHFLWWCNGHPDAAPIQGLDLSKTENVVLLSKHNSALHMARTLLGPELHPDRRECSGFTLEAVNALRKSNVQRAFLVTGCSPKDANFMTKDLSELVKMEGIDVFVKDSDLEGYRQEIETLPNNSLHKTRLKYLTYGTTKNRKCGRKEIHFLFNQKASRIVASSRDEISVDGVCLEGKEQEYIACGLVLKHGFKPLSIPGLVMDESGECIRNVRGRVVNQENVVEKGLYITGALQTGCSVNTIPLQVLGNVHEDLENGNLRVEKHAYGGGIASMLKASNKRFVSFDKWLPTEAALRSSFQ